MTKLANFFIVGAAKAGTTAICDMLSQHPEVYCSPVKEPNYFSRDILLQQDLYYGYQGVESKAEYNACFSKAKSEKIRLEASVSYFSYPQVAERIKQEVPNAKILIVLRDPIERAVSHYLMDKRLGFVKVELETIFNNPKDYNQYFYQYFEQGAYFERCRQYASLFDDEHLLVLSYQPDVSQLLGSICSFLSISDRYNFESQKSNLSMVPKSGFTKAIYQNEKLRKKLKSYMPTSLIMNIQRRMFTGQRVDISEAFRQELEAYFKADLQQLKAHYPLSFLRSRSLAEI